MSLAWLSHNGNGLVHNGYRLGIGTGYYLKNTFVFQRTNADNGTGVMTLSSTAGVSSYVLSGTATGVSANVSGIDKVLTHVTYTTDDGYRTTVLDHPASSRYSAVTSTAASSYFTGNGVWSGSVDGTGYYADKAQWKFGYNETSPTNIIVDPAKGALFRVTPVKGSWTASGETGASSNVAEHCGFCLGSYNPQISLSWNQPVEQVSAGLTVSWGSGSFAPTLPETGAYPIFSSYQVVTSGVGRTMNAPDKTESMWVSAHLTGTGYRQNFGGNDIYSENSADCRWREKWIRLGIGQNLIQHALADGIESGSTFDFTATASTTRTEMETGLLWNPVVGVIGGVNMRPALIDRYGGASSVHIAPCLKSPLSALPYYAPVYYWEKSASNQIHHIGTAHYSWVMSGTLLG